MFGKHEHCTLFNCFLQYSQVSKSDVINPMNAIQNFAKHMPIPKLAHVQSPSGQVKAKKEANFPLGIDLIVNSTSNKNYKAFHFKK